MFFYIVAMVPIVSIVVKLFDFDSFLDGCHNGECLGTF